MSLVGPRPLQLRDSARLLGKYFESAVIRLSTPPGLTGLSQISGRRDIDVTDMLNLDRSYVENWSLGEDLMILLKTVRCRAERTRHYVRSRHRGGVPWQDCLVF